MPWWVTLLIWLFIIIPLVGIAVAVVVAPVLERRHVADLEAREAEASDVVVSNLTRPVGEVSGRVHPRLVTGSVVMGVDWWKTFMLSLVNLVGGDAPSVDRVMTRARREAILRMTEEARALGATEVFNVRIDTSTITNQTGNSGRGSGEILCHGTALIPS